MQNNLESKSIEQRLAALEEGRREIVGQLSDIREIISLGFDDLFEYNRNRADAIRAVCDRLDKVEEHLTPTFHTVFPRQREFLSEVDAVLRPGKRD